MEKQTVLEALRGGMIVSCQALPHEPLHSSFIMGRMARAAKEAGAVAIRCNSVEDIVEIQRETHLPVIAIIKKDYEGSSVYITPTMEEVDALAAIHPDIIAMDATVSLRPGDKTLETFYREVRSKYPNQLLMADCSTYEEAIFADQLGFDFIGTTLVGYTEQSKGMRIEENDFELIRRIIAAVSHPVIAEGNISTPEKAKRVMQLGSFGVVTGSAITRPQLIAKDFVKAVREAKAERESSPASQRPQKHYIAIDIGGTAIKYGVVREDGVICLFDTIDTEAHLGGQAILKKVEAIVASLFGAWNPSGIGISTAGMVDSEKGIILHSGDTIPAYAGISFRECLERKFHIPCRVENDVNCMGLWEYHYGAARGSKVCLCITVGTGIGGCILLNGNVFHGACYGAGEIGYTHIGAPDGRSLEECASTSAVIRWIAQEKGELEHLWNGKRMIACARQQDKICLAAAERMADLLAREIANASFLLDPDRVVLGGGIMEQTDFWEPRISSALSRYWIRERKHNATIAFAKQGNQAGMMGAFCLFQQ